MPRVVSIHRYPVKAARGLMLERAVVGHRGIRFDRRFMVVRDDGSPEHGRAITQREHPRLALVEVVIDEQALAITAGSAAVAVPLAPLEAAGLPRLTVKLFDHVTEGVDTGAETSDLFSRFLGQAARLVYMPDAVVRPIPEGYGQPGDRVGFADGFPLLIASLASLADLNDRLVQRGEAAVPMNRFRPSVVVEGAPAWAEEEAAIVRIGNLELRTPKKCARCKVTTVDQATAATSKEPLRTLASFRTEKNKVNFAMNAIPCLAEDATAEIAVGDEVTFELRT